MGERYSKFEEIRDLKYEFRRLSLEETVSREPLNDALIEIQEELYTLQGRYYYPSVTEFVDHRIEEQLYEEDEEYEDD